jgi:hypothetical protein
MITTSHKVKKISKNKKYIIIRREREIIKRSIDEEEGVVVEDTVVGKRKNKESNFVFNQTVKLVAIHSVNFSFIQFRCFQRFQQLQCPLFLLLGFVIFPLFSIFISFHNFYQFSIFISVSHGTITQFGCFFLNLYTKLINLIFYFGAS